MILLEHFVGTRRLTPAWAGGQYVGRKRANGIEPGKSDDIIAVTRDLLADFKLLKSFNFLIARGEVVKD